MIFSGVVGQLHGICCGSHHKSELSFEEPLAFVVMAEEINHASISFRANSIHKIAYTVWMDTPRDATNTEFLTNNL